MISMLAEQHPASVLHLCLHRMCSGTVLSVGHLSFDSTQSPVHNNRSFVRKKQKTIDLKCKNILWVVTWPV